jgi:hypothetical protein
VYILGPTPHGFSWWTSHGEGDAGGAAESVSGADVVGGRSGSFATGVACMAMPCGWVSRALGEAVTEGRAVCGEREGWSVDLGEQQGWYGELFFIYIFGGGNDYLAMLVAQGVSIVARVAVDGTVDWLTRGNDDEDPSLGKWRICERCACTTCERGDPNALYQPFFVLQKPDESTGRWRNWYFGALDTNTIRRMLRLTSRTSCFDDCASPWAL